MFNPWPVHRNSDSPGGSGRIRLAVVDDLTATSLVAFVTASVTPGSVVLTDG